MIESPVQASDAKLAAALRQIAPTEKASVYEVLRQCGFDVSGWSLKRDGRAVENPAVNGRAYEWSFKDPATEQSAFMLWHAEMEVREDAIRYRRSWAGLVRELERTRPQTARRADAFLIHVSNLKPGAVVRVGIVEGTQSTSVDDQASSVSRRWLDPEPWHLSFWEPRTSTFEFTRGLPRGSDQKAGGGVETAQVPIDGVPEGAELPPGESLAEDLEDIRHSGRSETEKRRLVAARLGQGRFRAEVLERWGHACAVTGMTTLSALRASHCKPWRSADDIERLDPANGVPLAATLDALFDVGLIGFSDDGQLLASSEINDVALSLNGLSLCRALREDELAYVVYHRANIFRP